MLDLTALVCNTQPPLPLPPSLLLPSLHTSILSPDNWPFKISLFHLCFYCPVESACGLLQTGGYADGSGRRWHVLECFNASVMHGEFSAVLCLSVWERTGDPAGRKNDKWGLFKISVFLELVRQRENVFYFSDLSRKTFLIEIIQDLIMREMLSILLFIEYIKAISHKQECCCPECGNIQTRLSRLWLQV